MFSLTRQEQIVVIFLLGAIILGGGVLYYRNVIAERAEPEVIESEIKKASGGQVTVDIAGAVWRPGIYTLEAGSRVKDVVDKASPRGDANLEILNLAAPLKDGQKIIVPIKPPELAAGEGSRGETMSPSPSPDQGGKINLNTATQTELETLPHIGPVRAQAIIDYRNQHGGFKSIEEIKNIEGIGEQTFQKMKELIMVY